MSWNCQGMGSKLTIQILQEMRRSHFPDILFLLETKNSSNHVVNTQRWLGYDNVHTVDPEGLSGGLAIFWKSSYEVEVLFADKRIIDTHIKLGSLSFFVSFVYGDPVRHQRQEVWDKLTSIGATRTDPWMVVGDLNEIMDNSEKLGGPAREESSFYPFRNMVNDCRLRDIPFSGNKFSWAGERNKQWIQCRLDRSLGNSEWFHLFPRVNSEYLERIGSDHRPLLTRFASENQSHFGRFFFDKRWLSKPGFEQIIQEGWNRDLVDDSRNVMDRIADCRRSISQWKKANPSNSKTRIAGLREKLELEGQKQFPDLRAMRNWRWELEDAYREEEVYWKQRSKEHWLRDGDRNTKFFHGSVQQRRAKNKILSLFDGDDIERFSEGSKGNIAVDYFQRLFSSSHPLEPDELLEGMLPRVTDAMNIELIKPVSVEEIRKAAFGIRSSSAPGSDGMTGLFFKTYWNIVGPQVTKEVKQFFDEGHFPSEWNYTQLSLLPKKPNPCRMTDLRPISLCSVSYKIISRVLCSRLKQFLPEIVSDAQGAFVSGRLISDNILIAHEMVHALRTNPSCNEDFMAIKTDMSKAYDRVEWNFLEALFHKLGFHHKWIDWIMYCVRSVSYSVLLNGNSYGFIKPERGIRQGDPLSPFLFILCAEALVHVMNKAELEGRITGLRLTPQCPSVQHLLFADDSLFLSQANFKEGLEILRCLKLYGDASGQEINLLKSSITFGEKIDPIMRHVIGQCMGITQQGGAGKYLGLPECFSGSKRQLLQYITDKLKSRLSGWYDKTLSLGGKEILLKSVAMALPVYAMSCFRLTKYQCQKLTSAMSSFWWNSCEDKHKMHWVSWEKLCKSKKEGGLGFRDIGNFNQALLAKQAWRLLSVPSSLISRVYKARYFNHVDFLEARPGHRPSYAWRSILHGRELLSQGVMKSIGDGATTRVWLDKWVLDVVPRRPLNIQSQIDLNLMVSSLINSHGAWDMQTLSTLFPPTDVVKIAAIPPDHVSRDRYIWAFTKEGSYSVKSGHHLLVKSPNPTNSASPALQQINSLKEKVWKIRTLPKIKMFLWRALSGALAVAECLNSRGLQVDTLCKLCRIEPESVCHVLFLCTAARRVWEIANIWPHTHVFSHSLVENMEFILQQLNSQIIPANLKLAIPWLLWGIWKHMNSLLYENTQGDLNVLIDSALEESALWDTQSQIINGSDTVLRRSLPLSKHWKKPSADILKCNIHSSWINSRWMCGGSWIIRNHNGNVLFHARDAFTPTFNRIVSELTCILWSLQSIKDLHLATVEIWSDLGPAIDAIGQPDKWPRYSSLLAKIRRLLTELHGITFHLSSPQANTLARDIARSVSREGRLQSYLALGGPAWLHNRIEEERRHA